MKTYHQALLLGLLLPMVTNAESITAGIKIQEAEAALKAQGYTETGLQAVHRDQLNKVLGKSEKAEKDLENFRVWRVDLGALVVSYVVSTGIVTNLTFHFQDERPKGESKCFELRVISFDTKSAKMVIQTNQQNEAR